MNLFSKRFAALVDGSGLEQKELAVKLNVAASSVNNYLKGRVPTARALAKIARHFNVSTDYLIGGVEIHERECVVASGPKTTRFSHHKTAHSCPIISWASAGERHEYEDQGEGGARIATDCQDVNCYALTLEGDSMSPIYMHGDVLVAAPNQEAQHGDLVVAKTLRDEVYYKRLEYSRDMKTIRLVSFNPNYPVMEFGVAELRFLHPVFSITRYPQQKFNH